MRGKKDILGGMKEGTKTRSRTVGQVTGKSSVTSHGRTTGSLGSGHGGISLGSRKVTTKKGGTVK